MFHLFNSDISGIPLPEKFTFPFCYTPHPLAELAAGQVQDYLRSRTEWQEELGRGKMFGVLVVDKDGTVGFLAAFSGNIAHCSSHPFFVPPIYDLLRPDGFFLPEESRISDINRQIARLEESEAFRSLLRRQEEAELSRQSEVEAFRQRQVLNKMKRDEARRANPSPEELALLVKESQFEKAEMKRIKRRHEAEAEQTGAEIASFRKEIDRLKAERKQRSAALQQRLFDRFRVLNGRGESRGIRAIFEEARHELPPAGTGECAAPKLLQYAYANRMKPLAMAEFWWGESPKSEIRRHLHYYPACKGKCEPLLGYMLEGMDVEPNPMEAVGKPLTTVYEDDWLWVVDKPENLLSVPGKGNRPSVFDIAARRFPEVRSTLMVHRLDMHTSGLLVLAKTKEAHRNLQSQFMDRTVRKRYVAVLDGRVEADSGTIDLPLCRNLELRPLQMVSYEHGKSALTFFEVLERNPDGTTRVAFCPHTGRTHQLRVHAAHPSGLNAPIKGDPLYGHPADRLYLHAERIELTHPATNRRMEFVAPVPF